ncbi:MAG: hypothetical protein CMJ14_00200 [Pelagibacterales bacterium]|nr:hypothetical protein [Pelagibacterales bacterium]
MNFLAIDISLDNFNLLIGNKKSIIFSKTAKINKDRSQILFDTLNYIQNEKIFEYNKLGIISSTIGPGNFNGIRISISTIKAFKLVYKKLSISGVSSLDALIRSKSKSDLNTCVAIKSSPGYLYTQCYDKFFKPLNNVEVLCLENEIKLPISKNSFRLIGNGSEDLAEKLDCKVTRHNNNIITIEGLYESINNMINNSNYIDPTPLYLRNTNIVKPAKWKKAPIV